MFCPSCDLIIDTDDMFEPACKCITDAEKLSDSEFAEVYDSLPLHVRHHFTPPTPQENPPMKIDVVDYLKAFHGDDADAKAAASLYYGIQYLKDAVKDYESVLACVENNDDNADVIEKRAKASMVSAKRFLSGYHNRSKTEVS